MLYIFQVDTGRMMHLEISLAIVTVQNLKLYLERTCKIPSEKQVLLISGGEDLGPEVRVCNYPQVGTDSNPIYLFSKAIIESNSPPPASGQLPNSGLAEKVRDCSSLPSTLSTVVRRTQLAQQFYDDGLEQIKICEDLVIDQHFQQQGWAAVMANLEDLTSVLKERWEKYQENFKNFLSSRDSYLSFLKHFKDDLRTLQQIPVLPALIDSQILLVPEQDVVSEKEERENVQNSTTLLDWISQQKDEFLDNLYEYCVKGLLQADENGFTHLKNEIENIVRESENNELKEVKGLGERLYGLEELKIKAKKYLQEQMDIAQSFSRNQQRASNLREPSILPDLCATHLQQLKVLLENHNRLRGITERCIMSKNQLCNNLYQRLKWVVFIQNNLLELDNKLVFSFENLQTLQRQLDILKQVHRAPMTYFSAITEVVRRRSYSQSFLLWASELACHMLTIYNEELTRRKEFQAQFEEHFLNSLFPGMDDLPPSFATRAPSVFDSSLPRLSEEDIQKLKQELPEFASQLNMPDVSAVTNFFMQRSMMKDYTDKDDNKAVEEKIIEVVENAGAASNLDVAKATERESSATAPHLAAQLKELDRGCESETDTEEFEKVGQSPFDLHFDKGVQSPRPGTQDASTLTEDNLQISRSEYEKLRSYLITLSHLANQALNQLRQELIEIKNHLDIGKMAVAESCSGLVSAWCDIASERDNKEREMIQQITVDHELEISDFRKMSQGKNEEIKSLRQINENFEAEVNRITQENLELKSRLDEVMEGNARREEELKKQIEDVQTDKDKSVKEVTDRLKCEHRGEIENIRARFKLMTMERSPSENSLEKIEKGEYSSITNPEALLLQMTENFESEKEVAVSDAVTKECRKWQKILDDTIKDEQGKFKQEKELIIQDITRKICEDKDKQIDMLREQMRNLSLECIKYKGTLQQLTENKEESLTFEVAQRIENLEHEKMNLEMELLKCRSEKTSDMIASVAVYEGKVDATTSPIKYKRRSESSSPRSGSKLTVDTCKSGDLVMVVWDDTYKNFKVFQESAYMYFLHSDCLEDLGLEVKDEEPNKHYCCAEVVTKEYCHARKPVNRFKVPKGTKFFRVRVKPVGSVKEMPEPIQPTSALPQVHMSQSQTTTSSSEVVSTEGPHSLPSTPTKMQFLTWESSEVTSHGSIPEEKGEDLATTSDNPDEVSQHEGDIEKGTELTENFNVEVHESIDR